MIGKNYKTVSFDKFINNEKNVLLIILSETYNTNPFTLENHRITFKNHLFDNKL